MSSQRGGHREPFIRISKKADISRRKALTIRLMAVLLSLVIDGLIIVAVVHMNPLLVYEAIAQGAFGTYDRAWVTVRDAMILLCIAVGLAPAFKMRFWNIGAEGQVLVGGIISAFFMINYGNSMPTAMLFIVMFLTSAVCGALWGIVPAIFKAWWNTNETLFTLMMNYVAIQLTSYCVAKWERPPGSNSVGIINQLTRKGWFPSVFGQQYLLNVIIVMVLTVGMFIYLKYSKHGFEIAVVGDSSNTARYAGINVRLVVIRTMAISGALCGIAGFITVAGSSHTISTSTSGGRGFTAIIVAWLAKFNTFTMIVIAFLLMFFEKGAVEIASRYSLNDYVSDIITGIILFFILGSEFFINYDVKFHSLKSSRN